MLARTERKTMRTTLAINEDVFNIARQKAQREHLSIGAAVSEFDANGHTQHANVSCTAACYAKQICSVTRAE